MTAGDTERSKQRNTRIIQKTHYYTAGSEGWPRACSLSSELSCAVARTALFIWDRVVTHSATYRVVGHTHVRVSWREKFYLVENPSELSLEFSVDRAPKTLLLEKE